MEIESTANDTSQITWRSKLVAKSIITLASFMIINFYANLRYDMDSFLNDYPDSVLGKIVVNYAICLIFPIVFVGIGLAVKSSLKRLSAQFVVSVIFFYILWIVMFNIPGYPSPLDQNLFMESFFGYCVTTFLTMGLLTSDDLKQRFENFIEHHPIVIAMLIIAMLIITMLITN
jgi:hypothetical protein